MDDITLLCRQLERVNTELSKAPPVVDDLTTAYQYSRRTAHLRRERTRLQIQIELERANYLPELLDRTI